MFDLYDVTQKTINASTTEEANDILFGTDGISINSNEYYENVIANFIKKKEVVIRKENGKLIFDLNNYNDIWNTVFIGTYIMENDILRKDYELAKGNFLNEFNRMYEELQRIAEGHRPTDRTVVLTREDHDRINEQLNKKGEEIKKFISEKLEYTGDFPRLANREAYQRLIDECFAKNYKKVFETFYKIDWVELENSTDDIERLEATEVLKKSINIIHKLRNGFGHGDIILDKNLNINTEGFKISIPIEYLDCYAKGRIIAKEEDKIIVEKTNKVVSPILEELGYDIKEVKSFFYTVDPVLLAFLLDYFDNDYTCLFQLPHSAFMFGNMTQKLLPFISKEEAFKLPDVAFTYPRETIKYLEYEHSSNKKLDLNMIYHNDYHHVDKILGFIKEAQNIMPDIDVNSIISSRLNSASDVEKINKIINANGFDISIEEVLKAKVTSIDDFFDLYNKIIKSELDADMTMFQSNAFGIDRSDETIKLLMYFKSHNMDINYDNKCYINCSNTIEILENCNVDLDSVPIFAFRKPKEFIMIYNILQKNDVNIDLCALDEQALKKCYLIDDMIKELKCSGYDIEKMSINIFNHPREVIESLEYLKTIDNNIDVNKIYNNALVYPKKLKAAIEFCQNNDIDIENVGDYMFMHIFDLSEMYEYAKEKGVTIDCFKLPKYAYKFNLDEDTYSQMNSKIIIDYIAGKDIDLCKLPNCVFFYPKSAIELLDKIYPNKEMLNMLYLLDCSYLPYYKNLEYLCNKKIQNVNQLPDEFTHCDLSIIDELYKNYNANVARSIFGINNPKLISALIYCNSVLRKYQTEDSNLIDIDPIKAIHSGVADTYRYENNIANFSAKDDYLKQFVETSEGSVRNLEDVKSNLLNKLRNSTVHFRFKQVKDEKGNLVEDKIYIYDKYDYLNSNNFNMIIDIKDLVDIVREVELDLIKKDTTLEFKFVEENKFRSR